ncbi:MAG: hypothetical protein V7K14_07080 [Nostoc sp.]|nr:hypothetical protein [Nostoc sp. NMS7]MBN3946023.1 hypothetical protein [Nostoc sp. NMS7]
MLTLLHLAYIHCQQRSQPIELFANMEAFGQEGMLLPLPLNSSGDLTHL